MKTPEEGWQDFLNYEAGFIPVTFPGARDTCAIMAEYKKMFLAGVKWRDENPKNPSYLKCTDDLSTV